MEFMQQKTKLPVNNVEKIVGENVARPKRHGQLLPDSIRAVFCGPSNCGKTNALLSLIMHPNGLKFENINVYSKSLNQPKHVFLKESKITSKITFAWVDINILIHFIYVNLTLKLPNI